MSVSVVIPVRNAGRYLEKTLRAVLANSRPMEFIVVDDDSSDASVEIARQFDLKVICLDRQMYAAGARNRGVVESKGDILVFIDADILVGEKSIDEIVDYLESSEADAVFGSYDDKPADKAFVSQYANLRHHYYHQKSGGTSETFWAGYAAIRREAFLKAGGFYERDLGCEDIALGYRLNALGFRVVLNPSLQVSHLKRWSFFSLVHSDIVLRAVPWTRLRIDSDRKDTLNISRYEKGRAFLSLLFLVVALLVWFGFIHWGLLAAAAAALITANFSVARFFARKRDWVFAVAATAMHQLYYLYAGATYVLVRLTYAPSAAKTGSSTRRGSIQYSKNRVH